MFAGCTVVPKPVQPKVASFSVSGAQDSGVIEVLPNHFRNITAHSADRYNELIATYGWRFTPPLKPGDGMWMTESNTFVIDPLHWSDALRMNGWRKSGQLR